MTKGKIHIGIKSWWASLVFSFTIGMVILNYIYVPFLVNEKTYQLQQLQLKNEKLSQVNSSLENEINELSKKLDEIGIEQQKTLDDLAAHKEILLNLIATNDDKNLLNQYSQREVISEIVPTDLDIRKKVIEIEKLLINSNMAGATDGVTIMIKHKPGDSLEAEAIRRILVKMNMEVYMNETSKVIRSDRGVFKWIMSDRAAFAKASLSKTFSNYFGKSKTSLSDSLQTMVEVSL